MSNLTVEQRMEKAIGRLLHEPRYRALAGIIMMGKREVVDLPITARTNGRDEQYGRAWVSMLNDAMLRFLIVHETKHKMYRHLITWQHLARICAETANRAMDYVINLETIDENKDDFCVMPAINGKVIGCYDERFRGMNTEQVFRILIQEKKQGGGGNGDGDGDGDGGGNGGELDEHDWDGAKDMTAEEERQLTREIDRAIRQAKMAGNTMGTGDRSLDELVEVQVDWREVLRDFITATCAGKDYSTWRRPNRRFMSAGVYMPSAISEQVDELCIAVDTSGSVGQAELSVFLSEVKGICDVVKPKRIRLLYWGTGIVGDETYEGDAVGELVKSTKPKGGGGTNVECVPVYMKQHNIDPQAVIVLTDGYLGGSWGVWSQPVLWVILDNKGTTASCGKTLHVTTDNLRAA